MDVLVTCKNKEDSIKHEGAREFTVLYFDFSDAQGQLSSRWDQAEIQTHPSCYLLRMS